MTKEQKEELYAIIQANGSVFTQRLKLYRAIDALESSESEITRLKAELAEARKDLIAAYERISPSCKACGHRMHPPSHCSGPSRVGLGPCTCEGAAIDSARQQEEG